MPLKRYLIAPYNEGLVDNLKPWLIPDRAFSQLNNAYAFRGRVRKRWGTTYIDNNESNLSSRLRINIGTTDANGDFPLVPPFVVPGTIWQVGQQFSIGTAVFTVVTAGAPAPLLTTSVVATGMFDTTTGIVSFLGAS